MEWNLIALESEVHTRLAEARAASRAAALARSVGGGPLRSLAESGAALIRLARALAGRGRPEARSSRRSAPSIP